MDFAILLLLGLGYLLVDSGISGTSIVGSFQKLFPHSAHTTGTPPTPTGPTGGPGTGPQ